MQAHIFSRRNTPKLVKCKEYHCFAHLHIFLLSGLKEDNCILYLFLHSVCCDMLFWLKCQENLASLRYAIGSGRNMLIVYPDNSAYYETQPIEVSRRLAEMRTLKPHQRAFHTLCHIHPLMRPSPPMDLLPTFCTIRQWRFGSVWVSEFYSPTKYSPFHFKIL